MSTIGGKADIDSTAGVLRISKETANAIDDAIERMVAGLPIDEDELAASSTPSQPWRLSHEVELPPEYLRL